MSETTGRIALIEPEYEVAQVVCLALETEGHEVESFNQAREGLERCLNEHFDVLVLDQAQAELSGLEILERLAEAEKLPPSILITEFGESATASRAMQLGAIDYLVKDAGGSSGYLSLLPTLVEKALVRAREERKVERAEQRLEDSEQRYRQLVEQSLDGVIAVDPDMRVCLWNRAAERLFGYTGEEILGNSLLVLVPKRYRERVEQAWLQISLTGRGDRVSQTSEFILLTRNGRELPVEASIVTQRSGKRWSATAIVRDLTARREADRERNRLEGRIQESQHMESMGVMARGVSYEVNNVLMAIFGHVRRLEEKVHQGAPADECLESLTKITSTTQRASQLTRQLLSFCGQNEVQFRNLDIAELIEQHRDLLLTSLPANVQLRILSEGDPLYSLADASQITQVLVNLIKNASEAFEEEEGTVTLRIGCRFFAASELTDFVGAEGHAPGYYNYLSVEDNGPGIPPEIRKRIFDPFFTTKVIGRGLGLATARGIVLSHNGLIGIDPNSEEGTRVHILLPAAEEFGPVPQADQFEIVEHWHGSGIVLVVDDDEGVLDITGYLLKRMGFSTLRARNGREALEVFRRHQDELRLIVLDMVMPEITGLETFERIREIDQTTPVLFCSGYNEASALDDLESREKAAFLPKPFRRSQLAQAVRQLLREAERSA